MGLSFKKSHHLSLEYQHILDMSTFRGARVLSALGQHGIRCNRLHQRRIVSLGLTSLCQVTTKHRALLDANVAPVNKLDLSSSSLVSAVSSMMSTDVLTISEDGEPLVEDEEAGVTMAKSFSGYSDINGCIKRIHV